MTTRRGDVSLAQRVVGELERLVPTGATCLVAVSGGPDSLALLDLLHLHASAHGRGLVVGHVDHGIHAESHDVAARVAAMAAARALPFRMATLQLGAATSETRARIARRAALRQLSDDAGAAVIVLAHHADDQAETVLLRLLRGSGPAGLAGMAARRGRWVRPLLAIRRAELAAYLADRGLEAWTDPSNRDVRHLRSWLRTAVIPLLEERLPDVIDRVNRSGRQAASARRAWSEVPGQLAALDLKLSAHGISVAAPVLQGYRSALRHAVLAALGRRVGVLVGERRLNALDRLLDGKTGGAMSLSGAFGAELAFGRLTFYRIDDSAADAVSLAPDAAVRLGDAAFAVRCEPASAVTREGWTTALPIGKYLVRRWRRGDRIRPLGGTGSRAVSILLREARVSRSQRRTWPVLVDEGDATIVWVPGICRADAAVPTEGNEAWRVDCAIS